MKAPRTGQVPYRQGWLEGITLFILAEPIACGSSLARDQICATARTAPDP